MLLILLACFGGFGDSNFETETNTLVDSGALCTQEDGTLKVDFQTCLSSSCDTLLSAVCTATLDDDLLTVTATAEIESQIGGMCTDDCGFVEASCDGPYIEDTSVVRVSYGGSTVPFDDLEACAW
jgi:hypothetical protein